MIAYINDKPFKIIAGESLLEFAKRNNFHIPTLCDAPQLKAFGSCRVCSVDVALEKNAKKSDDVKGRQDNKLSDTIELTTQEESKVNVPALETISEQAFDLSVIDPAKIRSANQVDKWANMIDAMLSA